MVIIFAESSEIHSDGVHTRRQPPDECLPGKHAPAETVYNTESLSPIVLFFPMADWGTTFCVEISQA